MVAFDQPVRSIMRDVRTLPLDALFVLCEQKDMERPRTSELARAAGISKSYACEILGDRIPARSLAIHIFRRTGWKHPVIACLTDEQIAVFEAVEPWKPVAERAA